MSSAYKGFKKVSADEKKTVFKHPDGHFLHVAHKALGGEMKKKLDGLPVYAAYGVDTSSGDGEDDKGIAASLPAWATQPISQQISQSAQYQPELSKDRVQQAMANPDDPYAKAYPDKLAQAAHFYGLDQQSAPTDAAPAPQDNAPAPASLAPPQQAQETPAQTDATGGQPEESDAQNLPPENTIQGDQRELASEDQNAAQDYQKGFHDYYQQHANEFGQEDAAWQHDLSNGHVTPETYSDLFAKKSTLGKIGTIFGLMLSGAGSGLAHQQNALLGMMNTEIANDLDAQKQSKANAQNFLNIHMNQQLNQARISLMGKEENVQSAQARNLQQQANIQAQTFAWMKMNRAALHSLALKAASFPPGSPQAIAAQQQLALLGSAVNAENANLADVGASKAAQLDMLNQVVGGQSGMSPTALKMMGMKDVAEDVEKKTIPGISGMARAPIPQDKKDELQAMNTLDYKTNDLLQYIEQNKGTLNPQKRAVAAQKAEEMMNYYNNSIKGGVMTEGRLKWLDSQIKKNPLSIVQDLLGNTARLREIQNSNAQRKQILLNQVGLGSQQGQPEGSQEGSESTSKSGKPIVFRGGKWHYK